MPHVHYFAGKTAEYVGHTHHFAGVTGPEIPWGETHVHSFRATVTEAWPSKSHLHLVEGETSPVALSSPDHRHHLCGYTGVQGDPPHTHYYLEYTSPPVPL